MRYRYFVVTVAYDGHGALMVRNCVLWRRRPLDSDAEVARLETDLKELLDDQGREHVLLNFIPLGSEVHDV